MIEIDLKDHDDMERFFFGPQTDHDLIYGEIYGSIHKALDEGLDQVQFALISLESGEQLDMVCHSQDYVENLTNCLIYFEKAEAYEKCSAIQRLLKDLA